MYNETNSNENNFNLLVFDSNPYYQKNSTFSIAEKNEAKVL